MCRSEGPSAPLKLKRDGGELAVDGGVEIGVNKEEMVGIASERKW